MLEHGYEQLLNQLIRIYYQKSFTYGCVEWHCRYSECRGDGSSVAPEMQQD